MFEHPAPLLSRAVQCVLEHSKANVPAVGNHSKVDFSPGKREMTYQAPLPVSSMRILAPLVYTFVLYLDAKLAPGFATLH